MEYPASLSAKESEKLAPPSDIHLIIFKRMKFKGGYTEPHSVYRPSLLAHHIVWKRSMKEFDLSKIKGLGR
jgi:hypothetical protein